MQASKHRLVFGIGSGISHSLPGDRNDPVKYAPNAWRNILPKLDHDILVSAQYPTSEVIKAMREVWDPKEHLFVDSGGFTLYKKQLKMGADNPAFHKLCESAKKRFLNFIKKVDPKIVFELDNEYFRVDEDMLSPRNYLREQVKEILGRYPVPVFKMHQGFEYWKRLCDSDLYPMLSIGGFAATQDWHTKIAEVRIMMAYAHSKGKWVHLLGCQNIAAFRIIQPDSVDYAIFQLGININDAKREHPEWPPKPDWKTIMQPAALWGLARAVCRSHFYDGFREIYDEDDVNADEEGNEGIANDS